MPNPKMMLQSLEFSAADLSRGHTRYENEIQEGAPILVFDRVICPVDFEAWLVISISDGRYIF